MMTEGYITAQFNSSVRKPGSPKFKRFPNSSSSSNMNSFGYKDQMKRGNSFVVGQKLRESKWFGHNEISILCAVVETGFILELKKSETENQFGVAIWISGCEKSKNPNFLTIYTIAESKGKNKVAAMDLFDFWPEDTTVRINNQSDKKDTPLMERKIREQAIYAQHSRTKWHNSEHFAYYCRYGPIETNLRTRRITDQLKSNTETFFMKLKNFTVK